MNNFASAYHILTKLGNPYTRCLSMYQIQGNQITRFHFMVTFCTLMERIKKTYLWSTWHDLVEILGTDGGGHFHSENRWVSYKQHDVTYMRKLHYCSSCQYTHRYGVIWNLEPGVLTVEGIFTTEIIRIFTSSGKLCIRENCIIVLPVNILMPGRTK